MKDQILAKVLKVSLAVGSVCVLAPFVSAQGIGSTEMDNMLVSTPQRVERGAELFQQNCSVCHGKTGEGMANIQLAGADGRTFNTADFTKGEYNIAKGPIQAYNVITFGLEDALVGADVAAAEERLGGKVPTHPTFNFLQYQSRWDMVHYIRSLSPTAGRIDPEEIIAKAKDRAINGVCDEDIKSSLNEKVTPQGDEQLATGKEIFNANCASCHGQNGKSDNPVGSSLMPPARNFTTEDPKEWTNQPVNALSVFDAITNGVPGTSMASYANLGEDERWALTQYVLNWVPDSVKVDATEAQIVAACRSLSAPEAPEPISIDVAMRALIKDQAEQRAVRHAQYGAVELQAGADAKSGALTFMQSCASCHGNSGSGAATGPLGAQPPYFYLTTDRLSPAAAGGTTADFARRSYAGAHATLAGMSSAATLSKAEWSNLQAYVASFDGDVEIKVAAPKVDPEAVTTQGEVAPEGEAAPEAETE
ncbi:c-type cytochrome [Bradymonas sediminis]|nr:c-type cytochrome [Bradymonas sediminis]TDP75891.1 cbb3-type cytochrome c oxidase subunit III [Bradymonas sediminis]